MSQYQNLIALQSELQNSGSEQRQCQQDGGNRSLANMPIFPEAEERAPVLTSFRNAGGSKPRNFSSDLLQQALAAKSNLGLCDGLTRSDALQSLRLYGSSHDSPSKMGRILTPASNSGYLHPGLFSRNVQAESRQEHHGQNECYNYGHDKQFTQPGSFSDHQILPDHYSREDSQQNQKKSISDPNEGSFTPFRPPLQLNTVEDEDEFLYGDSTPVPDTQGEAPRPEETTTRKEGTGTWSDEDIMIVEDFSAGKLHNAAFESPRPNHSKETTGIPLKDLSWKSSTAWKDETVYNRKANKSRAQNMLESTYPSMNRQESSEAEIATPTLESSVLFPSAQQPEQLTSQEKKSKYVNAALLLKKQLDPNNLMRSDSPSGSTSQVTGQAVTEKSSKPLSSVGHPEGSQYPHLLINVEQGSNLSKKRVVSLTERDNSSSKDNRNRNASPATVQYDEDSEPEVTSVRVVRDISESTKYQEASKVIPSRYLEDNNKQKLDIYTREMYKKKYSHQDRSPGDSPWRISPSNYRHRTPSPEHRSRGRSRSPGYRSRNRSRHRQTEDFRREKSPRQRFRSRGRSPTQRYEERHRRDKSTDSRMYGKRQHSPDNSPRVMDKRPTLVKKKTPDGQRPVPPSVEASLSAETLEDGGLFPKSISPDMAVMFMRNTRPSTIPSASKIPNELIKPKPAEQYTDPVLHSTNEDIVVQKLNFTLKQMQQSDMLNDLVAAMQEEEEAKKVSILAEKVQLAMDANARETQAAAAFSQANSFIQPPPAVPYSSLSMFSPTVTHPAPTPTMPAMSQPYAYGMQSYCASAPPTFDASLLSTSFHYNQPMYNSQVPSTPSPVYNSQMSPTPLPVYNSQVPPPQPSTSKLANAAPANPSRWLRNVPVLSAEEISKSKESEEELMAKYCKRVEERDLSIKKLNSLSNETVEIKKTREDFEKKSKKVRSGNDTQFISQFQMLQEKANTELRRHIVEAKRLQEEVQDLEKKIAPPNLLRCKEKVNALCTEKAQEEKRSSVVYSCYDTGKNWCVQCSTKFSSIPELVQHLHTPEHLKHEGSCESVAKIEPPKVDTQGTSLKAAKGVEFVKPLNAFYCTLCEETLLNPKFAEHHLKGHDHTVKYLKFLQENPIYEEKQRLLLGARVSALAKENRLKDLSDISKAREIILKKQEAAEQLKKVQGRLQKEQQLQDPLQELGEGASQQPRKAGASIKATLVEKDKSKGPSAEVKKPKPPVIYIGRAPNFRPKVKEIKETEKNSAKVGSRASAANEFVGSSSKTSVHKPEKTPKKIESPGNRNIVSKIDKRGTEGRSRWEDVPADKKKDGTSPKIKVFGCQSEAESRKTEPQRKGSMTVQLQMNEPKTDNPAVNQALKNILYGSKNHLPGKDTQLSTIKLPESPPQRPPLPPRSDKVIVEPKAKLQQKKPLTEEEKDFLLLGINKSDMEPIATPKPPPSSLLPNRASSPAKATEENLPSPKVHARSPLSVPLPDVTVPPPNLNLLPSNVQLPNLQVPPPNLQIPPPALQVPLHNLHIPPPSLHMPNMQVPPPNMLLNNTPVMHIPYGQAYNTPTHVHGAGYHPQLQVSYSSQVVDMDLDFDGGTGSEIHVGAPRYNSASMNSAVRFQKDPAIEKRSGTASKPKPLVVSPDKNKAKILQSSQSGRNVSKAIVTKQNAHDSGLKHVIGSVAGSNEDRLICMAVLNSAIKTVLEKHLKNSSRDINTTIDTHSSSASELNVIVNFTDLKSQKGLSPELDSSSSFIPTDSAAVKELQRLANKASDVDDAKEIVKSEGPVCCLNATNVETTDKTKKVLDSDTTGEIAIHNIELDSNSSSGNVNNKNDSTLESEMHQESLLPNTEHVITCDSKDGRVISNQEDLTSLTQLFSVHGTDRHEISNVKETTEVSTSQFDMNNKENSALESKEHESLNLETANNNQSIIKENLHSEMASQESPVILVEKNLSLDRVPETSDNRALIKKKSEKCINLINNDYISESPLIHSIEHFMDPNVVGQPHEAFSESLQNPSFKQETVLQDENPETLPISTAEKKLQKCPFEITESSSLELCVSGIESMDVEQTDITSISTVEENIQKSPIEVTESSSLELCVSVIESMVVEQSNISTIAADSRIPFVATENNQALGTDFNSQDTHISGVESIDNEKNYTLIAVTEVSPETVGIIESNSLELCVSGIESMDVEPIDIPSISTVEADSQIPFVAIENTQTLGAEINSPATRVSDVLSIDVERRNTLIAMTEETDQETTSSCPISDPHKLDSENNSLDSCILGTESFDKENKNSPGLGPDYSDKSVCDRLDANTKLSSTSPEEKLKELEVLETNYRENDLVVEDLIKTNQCPMDVESSVNEMAIKSAIGKENTFILPSCEVRDKESSAQKTQSKEEIRNLDEESEHHVQVEDKQENVEFEFLNKDVPGDSQQTENQKGTEHPVNTLINPHEEMRQFIPPVIDLCSSNLPESVPSPGIEAPQHSLNPDKKTTDESKAEETSSSEAFYLVLSEDSCSRGNSAVNSSVPCLEKFDLDDSQSNSTLDDPPVLCEISIHKEEPTSQNICPLTKGIEKKDSDTDEYETEDGAE